MRRQEEKHKSGQRGTDTLGRCDCRPQIGPNDSTRLHQQTAGLQTEAAPADDEDNHDARSVSGHWSKHFGGVCQSLHASISMEINCFWVNIIQI